VELEDLKSCVIQEHINGFQKGLRQTTFFYKDVDVADVRFDVNKDVVDGMFVMRWSLVSRKMRERWRRRRK